MNIFVYGTLKAGFGNHRLLENSKFLGNGSLIGLNRLVDLGSFPGILCEDGPVTVIEGEVYGIDTLTLDRLDILESNGSFYQRLHRIINMNDGSEVDAIVYYLMDAGRYGFHRSVPPHSYTKDEVNHDIFEWPARHTTSEIRSNGMGRLD